MIELLNLMHYLTCMFGSSLRKAVDSEWKITWQRILSTLKM